MISQDQASTIALNLFGGEDAVEVREVIDGTTADNPYAAYTTASPKRVKCWIVVARRTALQFFLDGPVEVVWVSKKSGRILKSGTGQSGE